MIQKLELIEDLEGITKEDWIDYKSVRASANNLWGKEFYSAKALGEENTVEFIIRYSKSYEPLDTRIYRIMFRNKIFNISFFDNIKFKNKWLKIKAMEVVK